MTQRITSQMIGNTTVASIENDMNQLAQTQEELSTGYQINQPSDNPYGAALTISLNSQVSAYSAYQQNITQGVAVAETESASSSLQLGPADRARTIAQSLVVEGANGTMSQTDLQDSAQEVLQYISQIKQSADAQYDGSYIFGGRPVGDHAPWGFRQRRPPTRPARTSSPATRTAISYSIGPSTQLQVNARTFTACLGNGVGTGWHSPTARMPRRRRRAVQTAPVVCSRLCAPSIRRHDRHQTANNQADLGRLAADEPRAPTSARSSRCRPMWAPHRTGSRWRRLGSSR